MENNQESLTATQKMSRGAGWMSMGSIVSRVIGAIYIIPWLAMFGNFSNEANGLFNIGYQYYSLFLIIATAGIPSAISKEMAFYTAKNEFRNSLKIFKIAFILMCFLGLFAGGLLWLMAPIFSETSPVENPKDVIVVVRSLVPALVTLPVLSIMRGFFESFQDMKPSALSQIYEQIIRVVFILLATFISLNVLKRDLIFAVSISTFAAFIGSIAAIGILVFYFFKYKNQISNLVNTSGTNEIKVTYILKDIMLTALPFLITSSGITLMQLIDTNTFKNIMMNFSNLNVKDIAIQYAIFSGNVNKLIMIIISFAVAIGQTQVPILSNAFGKNDQILQQKLIQNNLVMFLVVMLPSVIGVIIVASPLYTVFYGYDPLGTYLLQISCVMAFILGLYFILYTSLQALGHHKTAILGLLSGIFVKMILQVPMLAVFGTQGAIFSTTIAFIVTNILYIFKLKKNNLVSIKQVFLSSKYIFFNTVTMGVFSTSAYYIFSNKIDLQNRAHSLLTLGLVAVIGGVIYLSMGIKNGVVQLVLGSDLKKRKAI